MLPLIMGAQRMAISSSIPAETSDLHRAVASSMTWTTGELDLQPRASGSRRLSESEGDDGAGGDRFGARSPGGLNNQVPEEATKLMDLLVVVGITLSVLLTCQHCGIRYWRRTNRKFYAQKRAKALQQAVRHARLGALIEQSKAGQEERQKPQPPRNGCKLASIALHASGQPPPRIAPHRMNHSESGQLSGQLREPADIEVIQLKASRSRVLATESRQSEAEHTSDAAAEGVIGDEEEDVDDALLPDFRPLPGLLVFPNLPVRDAASSTPWLICLMIEPIDILIMR